VLKYNDFPSNEFARKCLQRRLIYWPQGTPDGCLTGVVSSRLGRRLDLNPAWFCGFRKACELIKEADDCLLLAARSATAEFSDQAAKLFELRSLVVREPPAKQSFELWLHKMRKTCTSSAPATKYDVWISPRFDTLQNEDCSDLANIPVRDLAVAALANRLFVLHLRAGGNMESLVCERLLAMKNHDPNVVLAIGPTLVPQEIAHGLLELGATAWHVSEENPRRSSCPGSTLTSATMHDQVQQMSQKVRVLVHNPTEDHLYLTHCTRARFGPWPDQSQTEFAHELLMNATIEERTPLTSLLRILRLGRVVATGQGIRNRAPVVCWSEVPLSDLLRRRVFRAHRGRWDFEPYGISVRSDRLRELGARPVIYGDEQVWRDLAVEERPFFQPRTSQGRNSKRTYDWSAEREWRLVGDLLLEKIPSDAARLFAPTTEEAQRLARVSHWPVVVTLR
jgi:hypothetical protein